MLPLDAETAVMEILRADPAFADVSMGTLVPGDLEARLPFVHVARADGRISTPVWGTGPMKDTATLALTTWQRDLSEARRFAGTVVWTILRRPACPLSDGSTLVRAHHIAGPNQVGDAYGPAATYRFVSTITTTIH
ncbi:MAG: hypothetical protein ACRD0P_12775 [Stackebrandtia sp.]